ncbi:HdrB C-terminal domain-containing protein [Helicobacter pylori]|uniref:HdrB C-terminal domain-containing protein n=1 Tax=Helicobacter pylori TaxID=210 RepID=UPI003F9052FC
MHSLGLFYAFENLSLKASKIYKRDNDNTPTLFLSQIALMAMGEKNTQALGLDVHYHKFTFI